jgi:hypothetical protein
MGGLTMKKRKFQKIRSNKINLATTTNKDWGFIPVPNKGGATTNFEIPEWMFKREVEEMEGGVVNA